MTVVTGTSSTQAIAGTYSATYFEGPREGASPDMFSDGPVTKSPVAKSDEVKSKKQREPRKVEVKGKFSILTK